MGKKQNELSRLQESTLTLSAENATLRRKLSESERRYERSLANETRLLQAWHELQVTLVRQRDSIGTVLAKMESMLNDTGLFPVTTPSVSPSTKDLGMAGHEGLMISRRAVTIAHPPSPPFPIRYSEREGDYAHES